ncbi:tripartite tricarboxylate transporter substrate binding protein [Pusillimonas sp. TS35]|uniref:Bug family tripartite tricarboxylate transporter substrate binding protein n=1 Tax=Paracandidimonas lactea TaxID=2895524 RepID=UPI0013704129|nr:tripartite tricarboxylate transporter substrate binding protein [Paracandidimonas lactea]MYN14530.1 tripartite tricarboxylate transporter substrate binding protein [Pusillimonas sp. TS35]
MKLRILGATLLASVGLLAGMPSASAAYPKQPLKLVVPYPPGSGTDTIARYAAAKLESKLGQPVIVENKTGGNAIIAAEAVIRSKPDGYTLLWAANGPVTTNVALYKKLSYDPITDLAPVARLAFSPMGVYVPATSKFSSAQALFEAAKQTPPTLNYGSGSATYNIATEWLMSLVGGHANAINYKGSAPTISDLAGGQTDFAIVEYSAGLPLVKAGKIKLLAVTSDQRMPSAPDTPTVQELGYPDFFQVAWWGVFAPAGTPAPIISTLEHALLAIFTDKETEAWLLERNFSTFTGTGQELNAFQKKEIERERRLVKQFNIPQL